MPDGEPRPGSRGACPLAGVRGQSPCDLALDLRGGARNPKVAQNLTPTSQARQRQKAAPPHKPQPAARFLLFQNPRFWNRRREAASQQKRWEAKRSPTLPLTSENGSWR